MLDQVGVGREGTTVYGLIRSYSTRHGAGPFPTESESMTLALPDTANGFNPWQGDWRVGHLDVPLLQYSIIASDHEIDELVVSCLDRVEDDQVCLTYEDGRHVPQADTGRLTSAVPLYTPVAPVLDVLRDSVYVPVTITSYGPTAGDKKEI
jgi:adenylosuccinate synthase